MKTLSWRELRRIGNTDNANRWYPCEEVQEYFAHIREPSRAFPHSFARSAQTMKFAKWLIFNRPEIAENLELSLK